MSDAPRFVWDLAGRPPAPPGPAYTPGPAVCAMCGHTAQDTAPAAKALGGNFTDPACYNQPASTRICAPCAWCCAGRPPETIRGWSVIAAPGATLDASQPKAWALVHDRPGLCVTNRANPMPVARILAGPPPGPWAVTVAVSGQKHTLPYTRVNHGPGPWTVRMETTDVTADPAQFRTVLAHAARLRAAGHSAEHVRDTAPDMRAVKTRDDLDRARTHLGALAAFARSPLLDLALWCLTKTTTPTLTETL